MGDAWDDGSDDDWDVASDDDVLDARLGLKKLTTEDVPTFDDEEDLAVKEREAAAKAQSNELKKKGNALAAKKKAEQDAKEEEELARRAMELEAEAEANMTPEERRAMQRKKIEEADNALTDDLFGGVDAPTSAGGRGASGKAMGAGDTVNLTDLKDHLKHARKVAQCFKNHGKINFASAFLKECISQSKDVLDDAAISDLIKTCNVIKNEKVAATKRKVKGEAQKSKKRDKTAEAKAKKLATDLYGDSNQFDQYDAYGEDYEDAFF